MRFFKVEQMTIWCVVRFDKAGTNVMFFLIFSPKNLAKKLAFFAQTTASFCKNSDHNIDFLEKRRFFRRKFLKIAENCHHSIDT
jgi:hypothetical protein